MLEHFRTIYTGLIQQWTCELQKVSKGPTIGTCPKCGERFFRSRSDKVFCSRQCRSLAYKDRFADMVKEAEERSK
jgi:endogenous inhibitor of DNA gyrase (YacG/DUF329 family)